MTGKELKIRRITIDLTQVQLAEMLGVQKNTISRYETGDLAIPKAIELAVEAIESRIAKNQSSE